MRRFANFGLRCLTFGGVLGAILLPPSIAQSSGSEPDENFAVQDTVLVSLRRQGDPGALYALSGSDIQQPISDHPAEILNAIPGVNVQMNSGQEHLISLRSPVLNGGAGQGSFLILVDGVPTRAPAFGNVNALFELPYETAERIEVVAGPGGAQYGSNAVHGLINVVQPKAGADHPDYISLRGSTLERYRADTLLTGEALNTDYFFGGSIQSDQGWRDESGLEQQKLSFGAAHKVGGWKLTTSVFGTNLNQETAGFLQGEDAYKDKNLAETNPNPEAFRDAWSAHLRIRAETELAGGTFSVTPFALTQHMIFRQHFLPYKGLEKNGQDSLGLLLRYELPEEERTSLVIGADGQWASGYLKETQADPFGFFPGDIRFPVGVHYDYDVDTLSLAGFAEGRFQFSEDLMFLYGIRLEHHNYSYTTNTPAGVFGRFKVSEDRDDTFDLVTPKLGLVWSGLDNIDLYANYSRGERAPQASDLYRLQSNQGIAEAEVETIDSIELGARGKVPGTNIAFELAAYSMEKDNFFFRDANGLNVTDGKTEHQGVELGLFSDPSKGVIWRLGASYAEHNYAFDRDVRNVSEIIVDGNDVDTAPNWLADGRIGYAFYRGSILLDIDYVGEYFTNAANTRTYPGHVIANFRGDWHLNDSVSLDLAIRNVTDERYADRADFAFGNERYFPGEPRSLVLGVSLQY